MKDIDQRKRMGNLYTTKTAPAEKTMAGQQPDQQFHEKPVDSIQA